MLVTSLQESVCLVYTCASFGWMHLSEGRFWLQTVTPGREKCCLSRMIGVLLQDKQDVVAFATDAAVMFICFSQVTCLLLAQHCRVNFCLVLMTKTVLLPVMFACYCSVHLVVTMLPPFAQFSLPLTTGEAREEHGLETFCCVFSLKCSVLQ